MLKVEVESKESVYQVKFNNLTVAEIADLLGALENKSLFNSLYRAIQVDNDKIYCAKMNVDPKTGKDKLDD